VGTTRFSSGRSDPSTVRQILVVREHVGAVAVAHSVVAWGLDLDLVRVRPWAFFYLIHRVEQQTASKNRPFIVIFDPR
jgi:hypothetical protein